MGTLKTNITGIVRKTQKRLRVLILRITKAQLCAFQQSKRSRRNTAEREKNEVPEHSDASESAEDPVEAIESAEKEREENKRKKVSGSKIRPGQAMKSVEVVGKAHSKTQIQVEGVGNVLVAV